MKYFKYLMIVFVFSGMAVASIDEVGVKVRTSFGNCPTRLIGNLTSSLVDEFQKSMSLLDVKKRILRENLQKKNFLTNYQIKYDPLMQVLDFSYDCPAPIASVLIYEKEWSELYRAILGDNGKFYDPTFEVVLREEKKLDQVLPQLSYPVGEVDKELQLQIAMILKDKTFDLRDKISEMVINQDKELTIILSYKGRPISVFLGKSQWNEKLKKVERITEHLALKKNLPSIINIANPKKIVVKF